MDVFYSYWRFNVKTLGVTQYEVVDDEQGSYVLVYNGFSSCYNLFNFDKHIFSRINALTGPARGSDIEMVRKHAEGFDRIYCSVSTDYELEYIRPALDDRWLLGGPLITNKMNCLSNIDYRLGELPCEVTDKFAHEYFGVDNYDYTKYNSYFDTIMRLYPRRRALVHANVGGTCYWGKCTFCCFGTGRRKALTGNDLHQFLVNIDKTKSPCMAHLANPALSPSQLRAVLEYSPHKKNWHQLFIRAEKSINKVLSEFDNNEMQDTLVGLGIETTSQKIRNSILNKNLRDKDIFETIEHVVRLGGSFELSMMSNYFIADQECVDESREFVKKLEKIMPAEKYRPHKINELVITRWPLHKKGWLESITDFEIKKIYEHEFGWHYKVIIPEGTEAYRCNREMEKLFNNAKFNTNSFDMYMGDPNE